MSHFAIIALERIETEKEDFMKELPYDDYTLNAHTDYFGDIYTEEERKAVIKSKWLKNLFDGYAEIDTKKETITFLDRETIRQNFKSALKDIVGDLYAKAVAGELSGFEFRYAGIEYKEHATMFYLDCGYTSFQFIEDAVYYAGETFKIGNIFDAHI